MHSTSLVWERDHAVAAVVAKSELPGICGAINKRQLQCTSMRYDIKAIHVRTTPLPWRLPSAFQSPVHRALLWIFVKYKRNQSSIFKRMNDFRTSVLVAIVVRELVVSGSGHDVIAAIDRVRLLLC